MSARPTATLFGPIWRALGIARAPAAPSSSMLSDLVPIENSDDITPATPMDEPVLGQTLPDLTSLDLVVQRLKTFRWPRMVGDEKTVPYEDRVIAWALQLFAHHYLGGARPVGSAKLPALETEYQAQQTPRVDLTLLLKRFLLDGNRGVPPYLSEAQKRKAVDNTAIDAETQQSVLSMYMHVTELIKAILVRLCNTAEARGSTTSSSSSAQDDELMDRANAHAVITRVWSETLGQLDCLRIVLVRAHTRHFLSLAPYPLEWSDLINETVRYIHRCLDNVRRVEEHTMPLRREAVERDLALDQVHKRYDAHMQTLRAAQAEHARLQEELSQSQDVRRWLTWYNAGDANAILDSHAPPAPSPL